LSEAIGKEVNFLVKQPDIDENLKLPAVVLK
jgi:hypothetical protein